MSPTRSGGKRMSTNNCRSSGMITVWNCRRPWAKGQRCLKPAKDFDKLYRGSLTGKKIWWRFKRADGYPQALTGLYNAWPRNLECGGGQQVWHFDLRETGSSL